MCAANESTKSYFEENVRKSSTEDKESRSMIYLSMPLITCVEILCESRMSGSNTWDCITSKENRTEVMIK